MEKRSQKTSSATVVTKAQFPVQTHFFAKAGYGTIDVPHHSPLEEIAAAEDWLKNQGCSLVYGPLGASTWYSYRATLGPFDRPLFFGESNLAPEPWQQSGYSIAATYTSNLAGNAQQISSSHSRKEALLKQGWKLKTLEDINFMHALQNCHAISEAAFAKAFCYQEIELSAFVALYQPLLQQLDPRLILFAQAPDGSLAGFCLAYPDLLNPESQQFILKSLAVDPSYAGRGIGSWLVGEAHHKADSLGMRNGGIHALMWEGSFSRNISAHAGRLIRRYALYEKRLEAAQ